MKMIATTNLRKIKIKRDQASFLLKIRSFCFEIRQHCSQTQIFFFSYYVFSSYLRQHCSQTFIVQHSYPYQFSSYLRQHCSQTIPLVFIVSSSVFELSKTTLLSNSLSDALNLYVGFRAI